jgi:hypothetical protein
MTTTGPAMGMAAIATGQAATGTGAGLMSDDDLIRRGDALNKLRPYGSLVDVIDRIAALPAVSAPDVAELVEAAEAASQGYGVTP